MTTGVSIVLACAIGWVLVSGRLGRWSVTAPIVFALAGLLLGSGTHSLVTVSIGNDELRTIVELALALILFSDASRVSVRWFERPPSRIAARLLCIGLPLTIAAGLAVALPLFRGTGWVVLAVIGAALAPTDAALGASVMNDARIPVELRNVINVESGLNDGLATPFVLFFLALATAEGSHESVAHAAGGALVDILIAIVVGAGLGWLGGRLLLLADARGWSVSGQEPILPFALALMSYFLSVGASGNGFVAAFVAGVVFGTVTGARRPAQVMGFTELSGTLLTFFVWFVFGAAFIRPAFTSLNWQVLVYALISLTAVRMVPVALSLIGTGLNRDSVLLVGWLGPRGLASIVFALIAFDQLGPNKGGVLVGHVIAVTVTLSVLLHGLSAGPTAAWFARQSTPKTAVLPTNSAA